MQREKERIERTGGHLSSAVLLVSLIHLCVDLLFICEQDDENEYEHLSTVVRSEIEEKNRKDCAMPTPISSEDDQSVSLQF